MADTMTASARTASGYARGASAANLVPDVASPAFAEATASRAVSASPRGCRGPDFVEAISDWPEE